MSEKFEQHKLVSLLDILKMTNHPLMEKLDNLSEITEKFESDSQTDKVTNLELKETLEYIKNTVIELEKDINKELKELNCRMTKLEESERERKNI